jgi:Phosphotransferase enzyme family
MSHGLDLTALAAALAAMPGYTHVRCTDLTPLAVKGLAHDHIAIRNQGQLLRVPKQSQFALSAADNLAYQAACFERVAASGHGPRLHGVIGPAPRLPMGALIVDYIDGRPPRLPDDLPALAQAMAAVHSLPLPPATAHPPLAHHADPVGGAMVEIEAQVRLLDEAELDSAARAEIMDELAWARDFQRQAGARDQPVTLVITDTHPGNFLIRTDGRAIIVDLEKALYGSPATDLAHATIYSSTTWDPDTWADLNLSQLAGFYRDYLGRAAPELAESLRPWLIPLRRITMLRAITWCAKWQVLHRRAGLRGKETAASTEDWSAENSDPALIAHVAGRVADYLSPETLRRMRAEWLDSPSVDELI